MTGTKGIETVVIEPTNYCNLKCSGCFASTYMKREKGFIEISLVKKILDEETSLKRVIFHNWGEPFLWEGIFDAVDYAHSKGIKDIYISTNGTLLKGALLNRIVASPITTLQFSLDGVGAVYEKARGYSYSKVKNNILKFLEQNNRSLIKKDVWISVCLDEFTEQQKDKIESEWSGLVNRVKFQPRQYKMKTSLNGPCRWLFGKRFSNGVVLWDGRVTVCCSDFDGGLCIGDIHRNSLREIWDSAEMNYLRKLHKEGDFPARCQYCSEYKSANGDSEKDYWK